MSEIGYGQEPWRDRDELNLQMIHTSTNFIHFEDSQDNKMMKT